MKTGYLVNVVYNLDDGHDLSLSGVFINLDDAIKKIHEEMKENNEEELFTEFDWKHTSYNYEYSRSYGIEEVKIYE